MEMTLMDQGYQLMAYGMGVVFVFLTMLVGGVTVMSAAIGRFFPEPVETPKPVRTAPAATASNVVDPHTLAVISAAVQEHRSRHKR